MNQVKYILIAFFILLIAAFMLLSISGLSIAEQKTNEIVCGNIYDLQPITQNPFGQILFRQNCQSCHKIQGASPTAPELAGVLERGPWANRLKLHEWVRNPAAFKDPYTDALKKQYGYIMTGFPNLTDQEIDAIFDHMNMERPSVIYSIAKE
jgi:hypothetical protein